MPAALSSREKREARDKARCSDVGELLGSDMSRRGVELLRASQAALACATTPRGGSSSSSRAQLAEEDRPRTSVGRGLAAARDLSWITGEAYA
mmetsp:Transcript_22077/g.39145  ORF Transcript_22077/g.39145 Transcript_22077/m.39145 type:complete len:93 (+) Transcript_22077:494-772(+)